MQLIHVTYHLKRHAAPTQTGLGNICTVFHIAEQFLLVPYAHHDTADVGARQRSVELAPTTHRIAPHLWSACVAPGRRPEKRFLHRGIQKHAVANSIAKRAHKLQLKAWLLIWVRTDGIRTGIGLSPRYPPRPKPGNPLQSLYACTGC